MLRWSRHRVVAYCFLDGALFYPQEQRSRRWTWKMLKKFFRSTDRQSPFHNSGRGTKRKRSNKSTPPSTFKSCIICQKNIPSPNYVAHVNDCINRAEVRSKQAKSDSVRAENTSGERYDLDTVRKESRAFP